MNELSCPDSLSPGFRAMKPSSVSATIALLAAAISTTHATAIPNATVELAPRQSGISVLECTLQLSLVQCCQTFEPLGLIAGLIEPLLEAVGIPLPGLDTLVAFDCHPTVLGLGCTETTLCCTAVIPNENIGVDCERVDPIL